MNETGSKMDNTRPCGCYLRHARNGPGYHVAWEKGAAIVYHYEKSGDFSAADSAGWLPGSFDSLHAALAAVAGVEDRITGLSAGGDNYVTEPFSLEEVALRLRTVVTEDGGPSPVNRAYEAVRSLNAAIEAATTAVDALLAADPTVSEPRYGDGRWSQER